MTEQVTLANRALARAKSNLYFIEDCLEHVHRGGTDGAYSRSIYILLSYSAEMILKSCLLLTLPDATRTNLIEQVKTHDLENLSKKIPEATLHSLNINYVKRKEDSGFKEYILSLSDGKQIIVQDLIDVRYDFDKDNLRPIDPDESQRLSSEVDILLGIAKKIASTIQNV